MLIILHSGSDYQHRGWRLPSSGHKDGSRRVRREWERGLGQRRRRRGGGRGSCGGGRGRWRRESPGKTFKVRLSTCK